MDTCTRSLPSFHLRVFVAQTTWCTHWKLCAHTANLVHAPQIILAGGVHAMHYTSSHQLSNASMGGMGTSMVGRKPSDVLVGHTGRKLPGCSALLLV